MDPTVVASTLASLVEMLEHVAVDRTALSLLDPEVKDRLLAAMGRVSSPESADARRLGRQKRKAAKSARREEGRMLLASTTIRRERDNPLFLTPRRLQQASEDPDGSIDTSTLRERPINIPPSAGPSPGELPESRVCYVCRAPYTRVHAFYDQLCCSCGDYNWAKRHQTANLSGRVALVTGGRVKIGYQTCILLLRAGAQVIVTTRFPRDAAARFAAEPDAGDFIDRLQIHGVDLRHTPSVEALCARLLDTIPRLDVIINNACQTVRRPPGFYEHLLSAERAPLSLPSEMAAWVAPDVSLSDVSLSAEMTQLPLLPDDRYRGGDLFPAGRYDQDNQQVDLRNVNSWRLKLADVPTVELLEVHLVNAVAPFVLNARLKPLMQRVPTHDAHIVNVSAMEGQFYRTHKTDRHPHTNMAKAALNMLTRTSAADYIEDGIHMNSVDTGWVTDEDPADKALYKRTVHGFSPPLDIVDGAARICDPIFAGLNSGEHVWGLFLKDYKPTDW